MTLMDILQIATPKQRNLLQQVMGQQRGKALTDPGALASGKVNIVPPDYGRTQRGPAQTPTGRSMPPLRAFNRV